MIAPTTTRSAWDTLPPDVAREPLDSGGFRLVPASVSALQALMHVANRHASPLTFDPMAPSDRIGVDCRRLNRLIRHRREEFLVTTETGITLAQLQAAVQPTGQRFPLAYAPRRRLQTLLAEEPLSLSQGAQGPLHQWVTGITALTGDGASVHYGGEVVKNVTGYDLGKLFIGSHNQYGIITSVTLKLLPRPESIQTALLHVDTPTAAGEVLHAVGAISPPPAALALVRTRSRFGWHIVCRLEGFEVEVQEQRAALAPILATLPPDLQTPDLPEAVWEDWMTRCDWTQPNTPEALVLRVALLQNDLLALLAQEGSDPDTPLGSADVLLVDQAHQAMLRWRHPSLNFPQWIAGLFKAVQKAGGFVQCLHCPMGAGLSPAVFSTPIPPTLQTWQRRLKTQYDPTGILPADDFPDDVPQRPTP